MKMLAVGLGQAGTKIADLFIGWEMKQPVKCFNAIAVNTAKSDLMGLKNIPMENRVLIGETAVKGHGVGANNKLGAEIAMEEIDVILGAIDRMTKSDLDAFLLIAAGGGGTGSGAIPVVARHLKELYDEPVYALFILPAEAEGDIYTLNAARSLKTLIGEVDGTFLVDNGAFLRYGESVKEAYDRINAEIVRRIGLLARAGEATSYAKVGEVVVDASEVLNTIGRGGITSVGYAQEAIEKRARGKHTFLDDLGKATRVISIVKRAVRGKLTLPCDYTTAERALVLFAGPPVYMTRKGLDKARQWLEGEIAGSEVRAGDYPNPKADFLAAVVALSGVTESQRLKELFERAARAQERIKEVAEEGRRRFEELFEEAEDIEPLF